MKQRKRKLLESLGYRVSNAQEFLGLTDEEAAYVELKVTLSKSLRNLRAEKRISQDNLAKAMGSSQSRIAKMEAGDPSVSIDLLLKGLIALGANQQDIGKALLSNQVS
jgi:DNA-binding XRE family transcriptional regulator